LPRDIETSRALSHTQERALIYVETSRGHDDIASETKDVKKKLEVAMSDWTKCRALKRLGLSSRKK
jgi:hypothetical protein